LEFSSWIIHLIQSQKKSKRKEGKKMIQDIEDILTSQKKKKTTVPFKSIGILPVKEDNAAIATKNIETGTRILFEGSRFDIDYNVLEGHRFCVRKIHKDSHITSWGMPFAVATRDISPGQYLCNGTYTCVDSFVSHSKWQS